MSQSQQTTTDKTDAIEAFHEQIRETFDPHMKSRQALDAQGILPADQDGHDRQRHNDGRQMLRDFEMTPFYKEMESAARNEHAAAEHPQALAHLVSHIEKWEKWELGQDDPDLEDVPDLRRGMLEWFKDGEDRMRRLRTGGTDLLAHGEQGTTKTTLLHWLVTRIMELNPSENVLWQSSLDDAEWMTLARYATVCLPADVEVRVEADPYKATLADGANLEIAIEDICRDVIRYRDPSDLLTQLAARTPGQFYVVYPDPHFRKCETITGWRYHSMWDVDEATAATDLSHFWFALQEELVHGSQYNEWTTLIIDEAQKYLHQRASKDDHDWWSKVQDWAQTYGDARKARLSAFLACHKVKEIHGMVRDKIRWGATMNGEDFPSAAPINGSNTGQDLGQACIWSTQKWNKIGYPDMKKHCSVPADFHVGYPRYEEVADAKST